MRTTTVRRGLGITLLSVVMLVLALSGIAAAQADGETYPTITTDPPTSVGGSKVTVARGGTASSKLPFTGGDVALLTVLGVAAVGSGAAIVVFTRRRSTSASV